MYIYDPQGDLQPPFQGYGWEEGQWVRRPLLPSGGLWSPLLGAELRPQPMAGSALKSSFSNPSKSSVAHFRGK